MCNSRGEDQKLSLNIKIYAIKVIIQAVGRFKYQALF